MRMLAVALFAIGCGNEPPVVPAIRFLHTFGPEETELLNTIMTERRLPIEASRVPFARGQQVIGEILRIGRDCPDLIRIDATWLPGIAELLRPVPEPLGRLDWTPEAAALVRLGPSMLAVPQTVDGLVVIRSRTQVAPASPSIADLVAAARAACTPHAPTRSAYASTATGSCRGCAPRAASSRSPGSRGLERPAR
ncbi:MAG: hypothetical protein WKG01_21620 [Kofleriaceae bacterium]